MTLYFQLLRFPKSVLTVIVLACLLAGYFNQQFSFDASSDTLVVDGDPQLQRYIEMSELFTGDDFIVLVYQPRQPLFEKESLRTLADIQAELVTLPGIAKVTSILDVPLLKSPPVPIEELATGYKTLKSEGVNLELAKQELVNNPMFRNYLISTEGDATTLRLDLKSNAELTRLMLQRDEAPDTNIEAEYRQARDKFLTDREQLIAQIRLVRDRYSDTATVHISGVPMIAADMITFVKSDLITFGGLVFLMIVVLLWFFFRRVRWVALPLLVSFVSTWLTTGVLGYAVKPVTVISSNFISLLAILCISFSIHLIVRYRELLHEQPDLTHDDLIRETMASKFAPCLYTALTTLLAFGSMMASSIVPVEDFGWMMCLGIIVSFVVTYAVFPAMLILLGKGEPSTTLGQKVAITDWFGGISRHHPWRVIVLSVLVLGLAAGGLSRVTFDNRFVDYFDDDTDIHQGMIYIDQHLGGTLPFDVYIQLGAFEATDEEDDFFASDADDDGWEQRYWFTEDRVKQVAAVHDYIDQHPNVGKVMSIATLEQFARGFNNDEPLSSIALAYVLGEIPPDIREDLILAFAKPDSGYARISVRVMESGPTFSRDELIRGIKTFAVEEAGIAPEDIHVTGMMVLFNDMLKQLATSQRETLLYVIGATFLMFTLLLRSLLLAVLALIPNVLAAATVVSFMGYAGIPLDMMTITIAAICIGIGVDDAIHYLHRFREELDLGDIDHAIHESHDSIGRAMYFTTFIILAGFSVLVFSNFLPTVYFGGLTALAMLLALLANLVLLPSLLVVAYRGRHNTAAQTP